MPDEIELPPIPSNVTITVNPPPEPGQTAPASASEERIEALCQELRNDIGARLQSLNDLLSPQLSLIQQQTETLAQLLLSMAAQRVQLTDFLSEVSETEELEEEEEPEITEEETSLPPASVTAEDLPITQDSTVGLGQRRPPARIGLL